MHARTHASRSYGVGRRMSLKHTRVIIDAIHAGELEDVDYETLPLFGLKVGDLICDLYDL